MNDETLILAVETSCDETAAAVTKGRRVLSNIISSQINIHAVYGGVVPEIASRKHTEAISAVVDEALLAAGVKLSDIELFAVTCGPGLAGALIVGVSYAKALAFAMNKPIVGVNHIEGHICSNYINSTLEPPYLCLVVSGGHTHLIRVKDYCRYEILGKTRDDAAGEAFDKVARALGLPYPGGPQIDRLALSGDPCAISFPRAHSANDFSFSGLKSAVLNYLNRNKNDVSAADVAASFQQAVVDSLVSKTLEAADALEMDTIAIAGGVSANRKLRESFTSRCAEKGLKVILPEILYCTDNAAMIGICGHYRYMNGESAEFSLNAYPDLKF